LARSPVVLQPAPLWELSLDPLAPSQAQPSELSSAV
jgi:hypothetical protein